MNLTDQSRLDRNTRLSSLLFKRCDMNNNVWPDISHARYRMVRDHCEKHTTSAVR